MSTVPERDQDIIQFAVDHSEAWTQSAALIGLTPAQAAAFGTFMNEAQNAFNAARAAREASRAATVSQKAAIKALRTNAGDLVKIIRAYANTAADPAAVYATALIPPPAAPQRNRLPAPATDVKASLDASTGNLKISWKSQQPESGTSYIVKRRTSPTGEFTFVGVASGKKSFVDATLPAGVTQVEYIVQPQRSTLKGPDSAVLTVRFGRGGAGGASGIVGANATNMTTEFNTPTAPGLNFTTEQSTRTTRRRVA